MCFIYKVYVCGGGVVKMAHFMELFSDRHYLCVESANNNEVHQNNTRCNKRI